MFTTNFQAKILHRASSPQEYALYRAGLEWDLADPIVIEKREDFKSERCWGDRLEPYHHQVSNLITFCRRLPVTLIADDVGLGKTISAGMIMSELIARARLTKILVVCPKLIAPQWQEELRTKFDIPSEVALGNRLLQADVDGTGAIITTYQSAQRHLDSLPKDRFQMLVLDEAHKLRNLYGTVNPPQTARRFKKALEERRFRFVLMLTATPIQNRLWDLYSLVDLLTVARGHQNPFGNEGMFARRFIADDRTQARQLQESARDEFRSIVYGYMSRIRRHDARLYFPERVVQMHRVDPTEAELRLIQAIAKPIRLLHPLAQISILQALTSSPEALRAQLNNMERKGTLPAGLAAAVREIVGGMPMSAKLSGLGALVAKLKSENPARWRMVVFTGRLETQTTIQAYLDAQGLRTGIINGVSGPRNQETLARFQKDPPDCHVIVSTEAGSEGVNLQAANVVVNYDLPWNPMIVEQRIGRVQRLASRHAKVGVFNIMLRGTFEEYIVGRLMEKLQMASHAIGDLEALLEASGVDDGDDGKGGFDERIRRLVLAALEGKDVEAATRQEERSIEEAKRKLESEEGQINALLGAMEENEYIGPRAPSLPPASRSMEAREFALAAIRNLGGKVTETVDLPGHYLVEQNGSREYIRFEENHGASANTTLYAPGSAAFLQLVGRMIATGVHEVSSPDRQPVTESEDCARRWISAFGGTLRAVDVEDLHRRFQGKSVVRVRATVAHDSYERLVEVLCSPDEHHVRIARSDVGPVPYTFDDPRALGVNYRELDAGAQRDPAIAEFARFYLERRDLEMRAAGDNERKRKKLEDEFTPRMEMTLVALIGVIFHEVGMKVRYEIAEDATYESAITVVPHTQQVVRAPEFGTCARSGKSVPRDCLGTCQITGETALRHLLARSEISERYAYPEHIVLCSLSGKRVLKDEVELSDISGRWVVRSLLKTSAVSGKHAEPECFDRCEFTRDEMLKTELRVSEVSGKRYRIDQEMRSEGSGKLGHRLEFTKVSALSGKHAEPECFDLCAFTGSEVLKTELKVSEVSCKRYRMDQEMRSEGSGKLGHRLEFTKVSALSGKHAEPECFDLCEFTGDEVLKAELRVSEVSGKRYRMDQQMQSVVSGKKGHQQEFLICQETHQPIASQEAEQCQLTGKHVRPGILETCMVTQKRVLPSVLGRCAATGKRVIKSLLVKSSLSDAWVLDEVAIRSVAGRCCAPAEARPCSWSGRPSHPDDLRDCDLTGVPVHSEYLAARGQQPQLQPLIDLLNGIKRTGDALSAWDEVNAQIAALVGKGRCCVVSAALAPDKRHLAVCCEVRTLLGLRTHHVGALYSLPENALVGRLAIGKRTTNGWIKSKG